MSSLPHLDPAAAASLAAWLRGQESAMLACLEDWVGCESPSLDKAAVDRMSERVAQAFAAAGDFQMRRLSASECGDGLDLFAPGADLSLPELLILGHCDTVYPIGTLAHQPFRVSDSLAWGPGVMDMKAGLVSALFAWRALAASGLRPRRGIRFLFTGDEEIGSRASRGWIEDRARRAGVVLVLEPGLGLEGHLKTARKGIASYTLRARGRAAHAGVDFESGASAIVELARRIVEIAAWSDPARGVSLNPGVIRGGTRSNVVAAEAEVECDLRAWQPADLESLDRRLRGLVSGDPRVSLEITGGINRPPMPRTSAIASLFAATRALALPLGLALEESATGGGSDGNFTAALGVPTLDGLGVAGAGAHSPQEHCRLDTWPPRTALLACLLLML